MASIKLTSDGYSFHTMELKIHPDGKVYNKVLKKLYDGAGKSKDPHCRTYPITKYMTDTHRPHCSTILSPHGILLYLSDTIKKEWHNYTIKAVVNPRKVLEPESDYLGIAPTDSNSLERFQDEFTVQMRKYHLPEFLDEWTLARLDLCVNLQFSKVKSAREICRLLHKDLLPPKLERVFFFDPKSSKEEQKKQKSQDKHSVCLKNKSYSLIVYDKRYQVVTELSGKKNATADLPDCILRLELRCFSPYLDKLLDREKLSTSEQICWLALHSRELILKKIQQTFSSGIHHKPDAAKKLIECSDYQQGTIKQLCWLVDRTRYAFDLQQLECKMKKKFNLKPRIVAKRLRQLEELGIALVPLRKDFYLDQMPSLPLILELLEDDSTALKLKPNGTVEY